MAIEARIVRGSYSAAAEAAEEEEEEEAAARLPSPERPLDSPQTFYSSSKIALLSTKTNPKWEKREKPWKNISEKDGKKYSRGM